MELSKRLLAVAYEIGCDSIADIGTDHGYLPIYAVKNRIVKKAIACDINKGPLKRAAENVKRYGLDEAIETRLCNGLSGIRPGEADCIILSGMGGMLTLDILKAGERVLDKTCQLILQPQLDVDRVRRYIHEAGFKIAAETVVLEDGLFYNILNCYKGTEAKYTDTEYITGKANVIKNKETYEQYISFQLKGFYKIKASIENAENANEPLNDKSKQRLDEIHRLIAIYKNQLNKEVF